MTPEGQINDEAERNALKQCREYFNRAVDGMMDNRVDIEAIVRINAELLKEMHYSDKHLKAVEDKIKRMVNPINLCRQPYEQWQSRLKEKFLTQFLMSLTKPTSQSFNEGNIDVLLHPNFYALQ